MSKEQPSRLRLPAIDPREIASRTGSRYPAPFRKDVANRSKQALGDAAGLKSFGVNLVRLEPGTWSSQRHWHSHEDEFVYVLEGEITLVTDEGEQTLSPGIAAGFPAGKADGHRLENRGKEVAVYLEVGNRVDEDYVYYSEIDLEVRPSPEGPVFVHKNGEPWKDE